ncbi:MAG: peroxiredoxin [Armatimonadetes bacterium]|nr:peroxiredoxin [Armatimonadota bacterium]
MALSVGSKAPDFTLRSMTAEGLVDVKLSDNFGSKNTVLLFFPAAFTGVCTEQMCDMTAGLGDFGGVDAVVYGISADTPFAQAEWAKKSSISVQLLSDYQKETIEAYDVVLPDLVGLGKGSQRAAFVIDKEGVVRYSEQTPTPLEKPNAEAIMSALKGL